MHPYNVTLFFKKAAKAAEYILFKGSADEPVWLCIKCYE